MIPKKRLKTTPIQHIKDLLGSVHNGKLIITYYDPDPIEPPYSRTFDVICTEADIDECISKFESLVSAIEAIGNVRTQLDNGDNIDDLLTPEQIAVWKTYISDFDETFNAGNFDLEVIYDMRNCGAPLSDEEQEVIENHYEWFEAQCLKRLPKKAYTPMFLINYAQRYEFLISHNVSKDKLNEERIRLAEEMILYNYCI